MMKCTRLNSNYKGKLVGIYDFDQSQWNFQKVCYFINKCGYFYAIYFAWGTGYFRNNTILYLAMENLYSTYLTM